MSEDFVSDTAGALAMSFLDRALKSGKDVTIPSLGITIDGDNVSNIPVKWLAVPATQIWPHEWPAAEFQYTSQEAPVEADAYERMKQRAEAAERERDGAMTLLGKQVMDYTLMKQRLDTVAVEAAKAHVRIHELETKLAGLLPAAQPLVTSIEFLPVSDGESPNWDPAQELRARGERINDPRQPRE